MGGSWQSAASLAPGHGHSNGAPKRLVGNTVPWTGLKPQSQVTPAVVNSRKCKTRKKSVHKATAARAAFEPGPFFDRQLVSGILNVVFFFCG